MDVELSEEAHPADCDATHYSERITQTSAALAIPTASFRAESASPRVGEEPSSRVGCMAARDGNRTRLERGDALHTRFEVEAGHQPRNPRRG